MITKYKNYISGEISYYLAALLLCVTFLFMVLNLWSADLTIPFAYSGDAVFTSALIKGTIHNGWYMTNPFIGAPFGLNLYDYPLNYNLDMFLIKLISFIFPNWAVSMNIYFLLTFPMTAITSLFVLRKLKISPWLAVAGSLLFTFVPYHFMRGELHLPIAAYYLIPLIILVVLYIFEDEFLFSHYDNKSSRHFKAIISHKNIFSVVVCILIASVFLYYGFFSCFFLAVAGVCAAISNRRLMPLMNSFLLIGIIVLFILLYNIPTLVFHYVSGANPASMIRNPQGAEVYGLKIIQLLLPVPGHRFPLFAFISGEYSGTAPLVNENQSAALGIIGSIGFIILIIWVFYYLFNRNLTKQNGNLIKINQISSLNLAAVLLGTIGGVGAIISYAGYPQIRSYNRISIFIAFFSILTVIILLDYLVKKHSFTVKRKWIMPVCIFAVVCLGINDQTSPAFVPDYQNIKMEFLNDQYFVKNIEEQFPEDKMVFQLPYVAFPESPPQYKMADYDLFHAYLHSKTIHWSYGVMKGRYGDSWERDTSNKPANEMVKELSDAGFNGIYIDSYGYEDYGKAIIASLTNVLDITPLKSDNNRLYFFDMSKYNRDLESQ